MEFVPFPNITREMHLIRLKTDTPNLFQRWNTLLNHDAILDELEADIICFQGTACRVWPGLVLTFLYQR